MKPLKCSMTFMCILFVMVFSLMSEEKSLKLNSDILSGLKFRCIGPAFMSGRIGDIAIDPHDQKTWYIAVGSGGIWKTINSGTTFTPIFDNETSYSIGCVTVDPNHSLVIWVGTGENVSGRHVGYGDGIYKSLDGGKSWKNMGLKKSEHIDKIIVSPDDSKIIYVAAEGPLWNSGGERGVYMSVNGGNTWTSSLSINQNTGVTDLVMHPENTKILYAAAHQRRRHVAALINGGPGSAIYKTVDGGKNWKKLKKGLPKEDMGQIALAISPQNPDVLYASIETAIRKVNFYRSADAGSSWKKMNSYTTPGTGPHYYQELFASPHKFDRIYSMEINILVSDDGGKTWDRIPEKFKHGDNHALAFDKNDPDYLLCGSDGGLYETHDNGKTWRYMQNLPLTQFYRIAVDNEKPFYNIIGGTQDNSTQLGPSRTLNTSGIINTDWTVTLGGDGYACQIDPLDSNIMYCESQVGNLVRYDKKSGERTVIQPQPLPGEDAHRWNWDSPIIISPFSNKRLYFASQRLYKSEDRGDSWEAISGDLSKGQERLQMKYMNRTWSVDAIWDNDAMSYYGNITTISESPLMEDLIYCGTDDGLIQVTEDGGKNWRKIENFPSVPGGSFVNEVFASRHEKNTVFALFDNHKQGDFKPYILKSTNRGKTWVVISSNLPERHILWAIEQDFKNPDLIFLGTEFGMFFTINGGTNWIKLKGGLPTIAFRDIKIQKWENDLVCASFGRGIYILDDYSSLRSLSDKALKDDFILFPVKNTPLYFPISKIGRRSKGTQGHTFYTAKNPPDGVVFTYYLKKSLKSSKTNRRDKEKELSKKQKDVSFPGWDNIKNEDREESPQILFVVKDSENQIVRKIKGSTTKGLHRITWDMCYASLMPVRIKKPEASPFSYGDYGNGSGHTIIPGKYSVTMYKLINNQKIKVSESREFECYSLGLASIPIQDYQKLLNFRKKGAEIERDIAGAARVIGKKLEMIKYLKKALYNTPQDTDEIHKQAIKIKEKLLNLKDVLSGNSAKRDRAEPYNPGIYWRLGTIIWGTWSNHSPITKTNTQQFKIVQEQFSKFKMNLKKIVEIELPALLEKAKKAGTPWIPGFGLFDEE